MNADQLDLQTLRDRIAPVSLAQERTLPIFEPLRPLFPSAGLSRGRVVGCRGEAATTVALLAVAEAVRAGSWLAAVDVPMLGVDAAAELGVPLERMVGVSSSDHDWVEVMGAAVDGFDLVLTRVPASLRPGLPAVRKLLTRIQRRGAVVVALGNPAGGERSVLGDELVLSTSDRSWGGLGRGAGHLSRRVVEVEASGRRAPGRRRCTIQLAAPHPVGQSGDRRLDVSRVELDGVATVGVELARAERTAPVPSIAAAG